jgi:hypothetical protein
MSWRSKSSAKKVSSAKVRKSHFPAELSAKIRVRKRITQGDQRRRS